MANDINNNGGADLPSWYPADDNTDKTPLWYQMGEEDYAIKKALTVRQRQDPGTTSVDATRNTLKDVEKNRPTPEDFNPVKEVYEYTPPADNNIPQRSVIGNLGAGIEAGAKQTAGGLLYALGDFLPSNIDEGRYRELKNLIEMGEVDTNISVEQIDNVLNNLHNKSVEIIKDRALSEGYNIEAENLPLSHYEQIFRSSPGGFGKEFRRQYDLINRRINGYQTLKEVLSDPEVVQQYQDSVNNRTASGALRERGQKILESAPQGEGLAYQIGTFIPQSIPTIAAIAISPYTGGTSLAAIPKIIGLTNITALTGGVVGSTLHEYDTYMKETGGIPNNVDRLGIALASGAAELAFESIGFDVLMNNATKRIFGNKLAKALINSRLGNSVGKFIGNNPNSVGLFVQTLENLAISGATEGLEESFTEVAQNLLNNIYKNPEDKADFYEIRDNVVDAFIGGFMMAGLIAPASTFSQRMFERMQKKSKATLVQTADGNTYDAISSLGNVVTAMDSNGEVVSIPYENIVRTKTYNKEEINEALTDVQEAERVEQEAQVEQEIRSEIEQGANKNLNQVIEGTYNGMPVLVLEYDEKANVAIIKYDDPADGQTKSAGVPLEEVTITNTTPVDDVVSEVVAEANELEQGQVEDAIPETVSVSLPDSDTVLELNTRIPMDVFGPINSEIQAEKLKKQLESIVDPSQFTFEIYQEQDPRNPNRTIKRVVSMPVNPSAMTKGNLANEATAEVTPASTEEVPTNETTYVLSDDTPVTFTTREDGVDVSEPMISQSEAEKLRKRIEDVVDTDNFSVEIAKERNPENPKTTIKRVMVTPINVQEVAETTVLDETPTTEQVEPTVVEEVAEPVAEPVIDTETVEETPTPVLPVEELALETPTEVSETPTYGQSNTIVSTERYEQLRQQLRSKLNNLNSGFDPELFTIGSQMAMYHIEAGVRKFADFANAMIADVGEGVIPYLKSFYEGARVMPDMQNYANELDSHNDVVNYAFDNQNTTSNEPQRENTAAASPEGAALVTETAAIIEQSKLKKLQNARTYHRDNQIYMSDAIRKANNIIGTTEKMIEGLENQKQEIQKVFPDGQVLSLSIGNVTATSPSEMEALLTSQLGTKVDAEVSDILSGENMVENMLTTIANKYRTASEFIKRESPVKNLIDALNALEEDTINTIGSNQDTDFDTKQTIPVYSGNYQDFREKALIWQANRIDQINEQIGVAARDSILGEYRKMRKILRTQKGGYEESAKQITDFTKSLLNNSVFNQLSRSDMSRILTNIRNASTRLGIEKNLDKIFDIVLDKQIRVSEKILDKYLDLKVKDKNQNNVSIAKNVDDNTRVAIEALNEYRFESIEDINARIKELENKAENETDSFLVEKYHSEILGLRMAERYADEVGTVKKDIASVERDIKDTKASSRGRSTAQSRELIAALEEELREAKENLRIGLDNMILSLYTTVQNGINSKRNFDQEKEDHKIQVLSYAKKDLDGINPELNKKQKDKSKTRTILDAFMSPLHTFNFELKKYGRNAPGGEGYMYNYFVPEIIKASQTEYAGIMNATVMLNDKAIELFGEDWVKVMNKESNASSNKKINIYDSTGDSQPVDLTNGQIMYIYMVNKMSDGKVKLIEMGITDNVVSDIASNLSPKLIEMADWIQEQYLPTLRDKYNRTHVAVFGTQMAKIDNYVPLKIANEAIHEDVDVTNDNEGWLPSTITGSIINRTRNRKRVDIVNTDAMDLILRHTKDMERWNAYTPIIQDINALLSSKRFQSRIEYLGKGNYKTFKDAAKIAVGMYVPKTNAINDAVNIAGKAVARSKIAFRLNTALKQILSLPAFMTEASVDFYKNIGKNIVTPGVSFKWALDNLPLFEKRWKSRLAGNDKLDMSNEKIGKGLKWIDDNLGRAGMLPNAFVDAVTCAVGARSVYETNLKKYKSRGYSEERARGKALMDAEISYNETQQSAEGLFMSKIQSDRDFLSVAVSLFNNSNFAYGRRFVEGVRGIDKYVRRKDSMIEFRKNQLMRDNESLSEADAERFASQDVNKAFYKDLAQTAMFGFAIQFIWRVGGNGIYLLFGDDDEEKNNMIRESFIGSLITPVRGFAGGATLESAIDLALKGIYGSSLGSNLHPLISDAERIFKSVKKAIKDEDFIAATWQVTSFASSLAGVDINSITNAMAGLADLVATNKDLTWKNVALDFSLFINAPNSQTKELAKELEDGNTDRFIRKYIQYRTKYGPLYPLASDTKNPEAFETSARYNTLSKEYSKYQSELKKFEDKKDLVGLKNAKNKDLDKFGQKAKLISNNKSLINNIRKKDTITDEDRKAIEQANQRIKKAEQEAVNLFK